VHLFDFTIEIYYDTRSYKRQITESCTVSQFILFFVPTLVKIFYIIRFSCDCTVRVSNPGRSSFFRTRPDRPLDQPIFTHKEYLVIPRSKDTGAWC
jgi:hypothetical protein